MTKLHFDKDAPVEPAEIRRTIQRVANEDGFEDEVLSRIRDEQLGESIEKIVSRLAPREQEVLRLRFGLDRGQPRTLQEVGDHFGLTRERIRQIEAKAIGSLRHP